MLNFSTATLTHRHKIGEKLVGPTKNEERKDQISTECMQEIDHRILSGQRELSIPLINGSDSWKCDRWIKGFCVAERSLVLKY